MRDTVQVQHRIMEMCVRVMFFFVWNLRYFFQERCNKEILVEILNDTPVSSNPLIVETGNKFLF